MTVFVGLNDDVFLGARLEGERTGKNRVTAVEVLLLFEGEFEFGAVLDHLPGNTGSSATASA